jgi:hypothetical protein
MVPLFFPAISSSDRLVLENFTCINRAGEESTSVWKWWKTRPKPYVSRTFLHHLNPHRPNQLITHRSLQEEEAAAFAARQQARIETADAKTSKNRARRQKRKAGKSGDKDTSPGPGNGMASAEGGDSSKKRKLGLGTNAANGKGMVFRRPGEESEDDDEPQDAAKEEQAAPGSDHETELPPVPVVQEEGKIIIHDSDWARRYSRLDVVI